MLRVPSRLMLRASVLAALVGAADARAEPWPDLKSPPNARTEMIASDMVLNGRPSRLQRFQVRASDADILAFYRGQMGSQVIEKRIKGDPVISTKQGDFFVTVQLHTLDSQTVQGTVMITLLSGTPVSSPVLVDTRRVLPVETQVVSTVQSDDGGKRSLMLVGLNRNSVHANRDHVVEALQDRGFQITKEDAVGGTAATSFALQLSSSHEDATVTISDAGAYRSVVINRIRDTK